MRLLLRVCTLLQGPMSRKCSCCSEYVLCYKTQIMSRKCICCSEYVLCFETHCLTNAIVAQRRHVSSGIFPACTLLYRETQRLTIYSCRDPMSLHPFFQLMLPNVKIYCVSSAAYLPVPCLKTQYLVKVNYSSCLLSCFS